MKRVTDIDVETAIANAVGRAEIELSKVFNNGLDSEITGNFIFQLTTAIRSLLMGRPVVISRDHACGPLPRLIEDAPLGQVHPDADLLDPSAGPTDDRPVGRTVQ